LNSVSQKLDCATASADQRSGAKHAENMTKLLQWSQTSHIGTLIYGELRRVDGACRQVL